MAGNSTEPGRSVASKVAAILMSFTNGRGHALVDLARQAGLPTSTAHRLARELADRHLSTRPCGGGATSRPPRRPMALARAIWAGTSRRIASSARPAPMATGTCGGSVASSPGAAAWASAWTGTRT